MKKTLIVAFMYFFTIFGWSQNLNIQSDSLTNQFQRVNSFYLDIGGEGILGSIGYDKIIPATEKGAIVIGANIGYLADFIFKVNYLHGGPNNFLEVGAGISAPEMLIIPRLGYRYQGENGFLFRFGGMYFQTLNPNSFGDFPFLGLSLKVM